MDASSEQNQPQIPPQPNVAEPITSKPKSKTPLFALIGIILVVLVGVLGFFFGISYKKPSSTQKQVYTGPPPPVTPTIDPTGNWKTYTNTTYKFSFNYPTNYKITPISETTNDITLSSNNKTVLNILLLLNANETLKEVKKNPTQGGGAPVKNITDTTINNIPAIEFQMDCTNLRGCFGGPVVQTVHNNVEYIFNLYDKKNDDQILSTFKFTDQNQIGRAHV